MQIIRVIDNKTRWQVCNKYLASINKKATGSKKADPREESAEELARSSKASLTDESMNSTEFGGIDPAKRSEDYYTNMLLWGCDPHFDMTNNEFYHLTYEDEEDN